MQKIIIKKSIFISLIALLAFSFLATAVLAQEEDQPEADNQEAREVEIIQNVDRIREQVPPIRIENRDQPTSDRAGEVRDRAVEASGEVEDQAVTGQQRAEEARETAMTMMEDRIMSFFDRMTTRLMAAFDRIDQIADRVESRIEKLEATEETELTEAREHLQEVRQTLNEGRGMLEESEIAGRAILEAENPGQAFSQVRVLIKDSQVFLRNAHGQLTDAVTSLQSLTETEEEEETDSENDEETTQTE